MKSIILAVAPGNRLFPLSRTDSPTPFLKLFDGKSLFRMTLERALLFSVPDECYIVTNDATAPFVREELGDLPARVLGVPDAAIAMDAVHLGMEQIRKDWGIANVAILPSDHYLRMNEHYAMALHHAETLADDYLIVFGVRPTWPNISCGYIRPGPIIGQGPGYRVRQFTDARDLMDAKRQILAGCFWNSGMYLFNTDLFAAEAQRVAREAAEASAQLGSDIYELLPRRPAGSGLRLMTDHAAVVPLNTLWNDLGSLDALYRLEKKDGQGNAVRGEHVGIESSGNLVVSDRLVGTVGVDDLVIVETKEMLLVCSRDAARNVDELVAALKEKGDPRA